jgi:CO/xanthine dehydrogenase FAD-binding subunit
MTGDNRYHSIFGAEGMCIAVHPSDIAPALIALDAQVVTNNRTIPIEQFFAVRNPGNTVLDAGEIITEIQVPALPSGARSAFLKLAIRKSIDFPVVNVAVRAGGNSAPRIALNAVAPRPYRAAKAEAALQGRPINEANATAAGDAAVADANPVFEAARYKVQIARTLVKRALLSIA